MKNLDLEQMGVQEMDAVEIKEVDGGIWPYLIGALVGYALSADLGDIADAYNEGYDAARN
ncbi:MAG: class IIb bacteriocin, lactobin A/cerein 7B family [Bacteroidota bacterium]